MFVRRWFVVSFTTILAIALLAPASVGAPGGGRLSAAAAARKIDRHLAKRFDTEPIQQFVVEFTGKADLRKARSIAGFTQRGRFVLRSLVGTATKSQANAKRLVARTRGATATSFWITNVLVVRGGAGLAREIARLPEVRRVRPVKVYRVIKPVAVTPASDPEWGVAQIGADQVWEQGITGQGAVVANVDTGVDYLHPALVNQYRGNNGDGSFTHDYNWWDPTGVCGDSPCDNAAHGTHTMGTIVGGDGPGPFVPDIGVAPGARWIAAKGCEDFFCTETSLLSSGEFLLAPTDLEGNDPDPSLRPDVINNSWGSDDPSDTFFLGIVEAWRAAGIVPVFANGNAGEFGCGSAGTPGNFEQVLGIGATDIDDEIAFFSSLGPAPDGRIKPDVSAPGVDVTSSVPGDGYEAFSGTSMATPHVVGTVALMLSASPDLSGDFDSVAETLKATAVDRIDTSCGGDEDGDPNNVYGDGRIDALAAVDLVKSGGVLAGTVRNAKTSAPIGGARITADDGERRFGTVTDGGGRYELFLAAGTYTVTAEAFGYEMALAVGVEIVQDEVTTRNFRLAALPRFKVRGVVRAAEDGSRLSRVKVVALGTPLRPVFTNAQGRYALTLPIGTYTLQAAGGGCTEIGLAEVTLEDHDVARNFRLFRKLDEFGHGCRPINARWVNARFDTGLFGDDFSGRLRLPFAFPFYGERYRQVFISDNGYLNFLNADLYNPFPVAIPSPFEPNAAIYGLWQDLLVDEGGRIDYQTIGKRPNRAFVIEFSRVSTYSAEDPVSFEFKLWENGAIDLLYGNNRANPGDGRDALVGIENSEGTDALQFSFFEQLLGRNEAYRFQRVRTGRVHGVVRDANDGLPIEGATVTAMPGGRTATTDAAGAYSLRLRPGAYSLIASADLYWQSKQRVQIARGGNIAANFRLKAPEAGVTPTEVEAAVEFGQTAEATLAISNTGTAPLGWGAKERDLGVEPPELSRGQAHVLRRPEWAPARVPKNVPWATIPQPLQAEFLDTIIEDPAGDAVGSVDITTVRAGSDGSTLAAMAIDFTSDTPMDEVGGFVFLDTDQDPATGIPPEELFGKPTQDIGVDYFVDMFSIHDSEPVVVIVDTSTFEIVAVAPAAIEGQTVKFDIPLEAVGGDDGFIDTAMVLGDFEQPTDWAPDEGHGAIEPFTDVPWLSESPSGGRLLIGQSQNVTLTIGTPDLGPGEYHAFVVVVTNAPKQQALIVDVILTVALPDEFGGVTGTVTDAHSGDPIEGATVTLESEWQGEPVDITAQTDADGTYLLLGPEGAWPLTFAGDGYVPVEQDVEIVRGEKATGIDAALHLAQPHATVEGGPFTFILTPGRQATGEITLSNTEGHAELAFSTGEVDLGGAGAGASGKATGKGTWLHRSEKGVKVRSNRPGMPLAHPAAYRWRAANQTSDIQVLVYADDYIHTAPDTFVDQALQRLGLSYTAHYDGDWAGFESDLEDGGWDLVLVANDNFFPETSVLDALNTYVAGGGLLVFHGWTIGFEPSHPLWESLGFSWVEDDFDPPDPVHWWQPGHPAFLVPEAVPELTDLDGEIYGIYGQHVEPTDGESLAGYTSPGPDPDETAMILGASRRTVFKGFLDGQNSADLDDDGVPDGVELWTNLVFGIQSGFTSDVPWMSVQPAEGTVPQGGSADVTVAVDSTDLEPGLYRALALILTNDPDHRTFMVPVDLVVPAYQQGVNVGGGEYTDTRGDAYAADQAYSPGSFGYVGAGSTFSTSDPIAGTEDDVLYQSQRIGMGSYRFDVANGRYLVNLRFAELTANNMGERRFHVTIEDDPVLFNFDVFAQGGGQDVAVDRSFEVEVTDGHLDVEFFTQVGEPIVNAILVTMLPDGG